MKVIKLAVSLGGVIALSSCVAFGAAWTWGDPRVQLKDARELFMYFHHPGEAQHLIEQAMLTYQKRNDPLGLGNANMLYAQFLQSQAVVNSEGLFRKYGFIDQSVTFDNRLEKSSQYYAKALGYYRVAVTQEMAAGNYSTLTSVYGFMAWSHLALGAKHEACADLDLSLQAYHYQMRVNPNAHTQNQEWGGTPETIAAAKQQADCETAT
jgi:hypothetical protein